MVGHVQQNMLICLIVGSGIMCVQCNSNMNNTAFCVTSIPMPTNCTTCKSRSASVNPGSSECTEHQTMDSCLIAKTLDKNGE